MARLPIMIDSSKLSVVEAGLQSLPGKGVVNSLSLKDGEAAFLEAARRIRRYGAAVVVMAFDETGQAVDADRKTAICSRAYRLLTGDASTRMCWAVATGMAEHDHYGVEFLRALPRIREACPGSLLSGGISNLSFAFRGNEGVRQAMNSVFLHHAIAAGLDLGIVNAGRLPAYDQIPPDLRERVEDVVLARRPDAAERLVEVAAGARAGATGGRADLEWREAPVEERLAHAVIHGVLDFIVEDTEEARRLLPSPLAGHRGAAHGRDAGGGRPVRRRPDVPAAGGEERPGHEALRWRSSSPTWRTGSGRTGSGAAGGRREGGGARHREGEDVHDIGKSIVGIVLACNGYRVEDLGA